MLSWLSFRAGRRKASELYGALVTQSRQRPFYADLGVPDTPTGRTEMIVLHLALVLDRLAAEPTPDREAQRLLVEAFVTDLDDAMRELGVGDLSVPRKVKAAAGALYERVSRYREPLTAASPAPLAAMLAQTVLAQAPGAPADAPDRLAAYARASRAALATHGTGEILAGRLRFPPVSDSPANP
ncbi:MAG: ubiquinol-cytochrome C chaperone family protein [Pseudomonadota bacterium]